MYKQGLTLLLFLLLCAGCAPSSTQPSSTSTPTQSTSNTADLSPSAVPPAPTASVPVPNDVSPASSERLLHLYGESHSFIFDSSGRLLSEADAYTPLYAVDTRKAQYHMRTRQEDSGADNADGEPLINTYCALYTIDGKLLQDWAEIDYSPAMGPFVIRQTRKNMWSAPTDLDAGYQTALWNPQTGETVLEGIDAVQSLGDQRFLALDVYGKILGILDQDGKICKGFPLADDYFYPTIAHHLLVVDAPSDRTSTQTEKPKKPNSLLLDQDFTVLLQKERINIGFQGLRGPYLYYEQGDALGIYSLTEHVTLFETDKKDQRLDYFDGERIILREMASGTWVNWMMDIAANALTPKLDQLVAVTPLQEDRNTRSPATEFLAVHADRAMLLDHDGKERLFAIIPHLESLNSLADGLYTFTTMSGSAEKATFRAGLLDASFQVILPADRYSYISPLYRYDGYTPFKTDLLIGSHLLPSGVQVSDLLDASGQVILSNLSQIGTVDTDRIAVRRGSSVGLIDYQGNWVSKHSIYDILGDD